MRIVHFGAGNIGRGAIPEIFNGIYDELVFIDPNPVIVEQLNKITTYKIIHNNEISISKYRALQSSQKAAILNALASADVISTSCGINNLEAVATLLNELPKLDKRPYVIAFENNVRPSSLLKSFIKNQEQFIFLDCTIDRIVPKQAVQTNVLDVHTEPYLAVVIEQQTNMHNLEWFKNVTLVPDLEKHISLKLYGVNGLHFVIAVLAFDHKIKYVHEVFTNHIETMELIQVYVNCLEYFLISTYNFDSTYIKDYLCKNLNRFANAELKDECTRIARNALLKLSPDNRVVPVLKSCLNNPNCSSHECNKLMRILKTLISYDNPSDEDSAKLKTLIKQKGIIPAIKEITKLDIK